MEIQYNCPRFTNSLFYASCPCFWINYTFSQAANTVSGGQCWAVACPSRYLHGQGCPWLWRTTWNSSLGGSRCSLLPREPMWSRKPSWADWRGACRSWKASERWVCRAGQKRVTSALTWRQRNNHGVSQFTHLILRYVHVWAQFAEAEWAVLVDLHYVPVCILTRVYKAETHLLWRVAVLLNKEQ